MRHRILPNWFIVFFLLLAVAPFARAAEDPVVVSVELARETTGTQDTPLAVVWLDPAPGYHAYAHEPGAQTRPTVVSLHDEGGTPLGVPVLYLPGESIEDPVTPGLTVRAYGPRTPVFVRVPTALAGRSLRLRATMLLCSDRNCWPVSKELVLEVPGRADLAALPGAAMQPWASLLAQAAEGRPVEGARAVGEGATDSTAAVRPAKGGEGPAVSIPESRSGASVQVAAGGEKQERGAGALSGMPSGPPDAARQGGDTAHAPKGSGDAASGRGEQGVQAGRAFSGDPGQKADAALSGTSLQEVPVAVRTVASWNLTPRFFAPELEVTGLGKALLLGLLAGLILNVMPCVLPVISLKLSGFIAASATAGSDTARRAGFREHNLFFAAGILTWFLLLAGILAAAGLAWGQLFQRPGVIFALLLVVFTLGLSMFGVFSLPVLDLKAGTSGSPRVQAFSTGVVATLLATPCSGPLLGGVLGWAFRQPPSTLALVFGFVGLGMSLPYLLMAARPGLVRYFPRPGAWTGVMEQMVGFFLMGTAVYLLTILPSTLMVSALVTLLVAGVAAWLWGTWAGPGASTVQRVTVRLLALGLVSFAVVSSLGGVTEETRWEAYDAVAFRALVGKEPVIVDFTADWCPNCKLLERTTLKSANMARWQKTYGARLVRVDLTRDDPEGQALLHALGSSSIPVVALFPKGLLRNAPLVLRDLFTTDQMEQALEQAFGPARE